MGRTHGIPTVHKGRRHRSRLEARWAAFFDLVGWPYEYEPFDLGGWIPDFILPGKVPVLVEIKPVTKFPRDVAEKIEHSGCTHDVLILGCTIPVDWIGPFDPRDSEALLSSYYEASTFGWLGVQSVVVVPFALRHAASILCHCDFLGISVHAKGDQLFIDNLPKVFPSALINSLNAVKAEAISLLSTSPFPMGWNPGWLKQDSMKAWLRDATSHSPLAAQKFLWGDAVFGRFEPGDRLGFFHEPYDLTYGLVDRISGLQSPSLSNIITLDSYRFLLPWAEAGNRTQWRSSP